MLRFGAGIQVGNGAYQQSDLASWFPPLGSSIGFKAVPYYAGLHLQAAGLPSFLDRIREIFRFVAVLRSCRLWRIGCTVQIAPTEKLLKLKDLDRRNLVADQLRFCE